MVTSSARRKSKMDKPLDSLAEIIDSGARKMSPRELRESENKFNQIVDRAVAAPRRVAKRLD